jgi:hypothetical protein
MSWQRSIEAAVRALKKQEAALSKELRVVREKIDELESLSKSGPTRARRKATGNSRRLSSKGRAAISKAAKKRWAEYRRQKRQSERGG